MKRQLRILYGVMLNVWIFFGQDYFLARIRSAFASLGPNRTVDCVIVDTARFDAVADHHESEILCALVVQIFSYGIKIGQLLKKSDTFVNPTSLPKMRQVSVMVFRIIIWLSLVEGKS